MSRAPPSPTPLEGIACPSLPLDVASLPNGLVNASVPQLKLQHAACRVALQLQSCATRRGMQHIN